MEIDKSQALEKIVTIARQNDLSLDDIGAAFAKNDGKGKDKDNNMLIRILGYLGAIFIFGGLCLFIGMQWDLFSSAARVVITYGTGFVAFILGILAVKDSRYVGASTPLFLVSAALMPTGMFVFLQEYANGDDEKLAATIVFGILAVQYLTSFYSLRKTSLLFFGFVFSASSLFIFMDILGIPEELIGASISLSILMITRKIDTTSHRAIAPFWYFVGGVGLLMSSYEIFKSSPVDIVLLAISVIMMFVSVRIHSRTFLLVSTAGLLCFLGYYTNEYFKDIVGWPIALMVMGIMLIGVSLWAVKLNKKIKMM